MIFCLYFIGKLYVTGGKINGATTNRAEVINMANHTGYKLHFLLCRFLVATTPQLLQVHVSSRLEGIMDGINAHGHASFMTLGPTGEFKAHRNIEDDR